MGGGVHNQQACSKGFAHGSTEGRQHQTESTSYRNKANKNDYFHNNKRMKSQLSLEL